MEVRHMSKKYESDRVKEGVLDREIEEIWGELGPEDVSHIARFNRLTPEAQSYVSDVALKLLNLRQPDDEQDS